MKPLLIIGASSFGKLVSVLAKDAGRDTAGFIDDFVQAESVIGCTADLGEQFRSDDFELVMAIGYNHLQARLNMYRKLCALGFTFPTLVHPSARVSRYAQISAGSLVMANVDVDAFSCISEICVLWPNVTISHDNMIGENTFISPAATLCGFVTVGGSSFIGANSTIVDGSAVPSNSFIKAAARYYIRANNA